MILEQRARSLPIKDRVVRPHSRLFRLTASTAIAALLVTSVPPLPAFAQMGAAVFAASQQQQQSGDPPARVGRLARATGSVSFHTAEADQWSPAQTNYPVSSGDAFWTEPNGQAELQIDASRIQLAGDAEFVVGQLDENGLQATQGQGEAYLHLRGVRPNEVWSVQTPRGLVTLAGNGRYAIVAGDTQSPTTVTVLDGSAQVTGPDLNLQVGPNQGATITGSDTFQGTLGPAQQDAFVTAMLQREQPPPAPAVAPPPVVASMPGGDDLAAYGMWSEAPEYGQVWYPHVAVGWVPYREGHWAWVPPWGWTWVDDEPWGFAPFHYGRWVQIGGRWAWTPGMVAVAEPPVYAPALVTFFGVAAGVGIATALASGTIGWCPLGPREAYHPWYHASEHYWREVNVRHVTNITTINRTVVIDRYVNRSAATLVPAGVMQASRPVRPAVRQIDQRVLAAARPVVGRAAVAPSRATFGVTAATARQTRLAPLPQGATVPHAAHGPAIRPAAMPGAARPQQAAPHARPPLLTPQQRVQPAQQTRSATPSGAPAHAMPSVVQPGNRPNAPAPAHTVPLQPRAAGPGGAVTTPHAPPLRHPGERPPAATTVPHVPGVATPHAQAPVTAPAARPVAPVRPAVPPPHPAITPHVQTPAARTAPAYQAPRPQPHAPAQATPYHPPAVATPQSHAPASVPRVYHPPSQAAPHYQTPVHTAPPPQPRPAPQVYHPPAQAAPHYQTPVHAAPPPRPGPQPRPAPQPTHASPAPHPAPQQDRQKKPGEH